MIFLVSLYYLILVPYSQRLMAGMQFYNMRDSKFHQTIFMFERFCFELLCIRNLNTKLNNWNNETEVFGFKSSISKVEWNLHTYDWDGITKLPS
jgi:hypothetical protein